MCSKLKDEDVELTCPEELEVRSGLLFALELDGAANLGHLKSDELGWFFSAAVVLAKDPGGFIYLIVRDEPPWTFRDEINQGYLENRDKCL